MTFVHWDSSDVCQLMEPTLLWLHHWDLDLAKAGNGLRLYSLYILLHPVLETLLYWYIHRIVPWHHTKYRTQASLHHVDGWVLILAKPAPCTAFRRVFWPAFSPTIGPHSGQPSTMEKLCPVLELGHYCMSCILRLSSTCVHGDTESGGTPPNQRCLKNKTF